MGRFRLFALGGVAGFQGLVGRFSKREGLGSIRGLVSDYLLPKSGAALNPKP